MIGTSLPSYIFIRLCILFLHSIAPLSILYFLYSLAYPPTSPIPRLLQIGAFLETAFYVLIYLPLRHRLQAPATHPQALSPADRRQLFGRCHESIPDPERYLKEWFMGASAKEIKRENVKEFLSWAFWDGEVVDAGDEEQLEEFVVEMESRLGRKLEEGWGSARAFRLGFERVDMWHRSLLWYLCVSVVDTLASLYLHFHAFSLHRSTLHRFATLFPFRPLTLLTQHRSRAPTLTYWHRPHTSKTRLPVLFIHGIGIGLYPYVNFLAELNANVEGDGDDGEVGIIAVEVMAVSFRITGQVLGKEDMGREIGRILEGVGWERVVLVAHSYGSVITTHLLHTPSIASKIGSILLIDPVCFLLHLPDVAYNFLHRLPIRANEHQLYYFASKDPLVSHTLSRRFFWSESILWKEDIRDRRVTVVLGGKDLIVNTEAVRAYLTDDMGTRREKEKEDGEKGLGKESGGLDVLWFADLDHAQVFDRKRTRKMLVDVVRSYCVRE